MSGDMSTATEVFCEINRKFENDRTKSVIASNGNANGSGNNNKSNNDRIGDARSY